ncbi:Nucleic acid-binding, OB-fold [Sesbania bispinosa]|nr:Nucleic acid-binding, OB-fold [Sesbania bispinosa]
MDEFPSFIHPVKDITPVIDTWNLKVKVLRMWSAPNMYNPSEFVCLDMILMDSEGARIEASLPNALLNAFRFELVEDRFYRLLNLSVVPNVGPYKTTPHKYKLLFMKKTRIALDVPFPTGPYSLVPVCAADVSKKWEQLDYMIDFVGVLTSISSENQHMIFGIMKRFIFLEITDHTGKIQCVLYDEYVDVVQNYLKIHGMSRPILVIQFAKLSPVGGVIFGGSNIQNMFSATRLLFNPVLPEVVDFRRSAAMLGIDLEGRIGFLHRIMSYVSVRDDFLNLNPPKKLSDLRSSPQSGVFVVWVKIIKVVNEGRWWFLECKCRNPVVPKEGIYYCSECRRNVVNVIPRYQLKFEVYDSNDCIIVALDDSDVERMLNKSCKSILDDIEDPLAKTIPELFHSLTGKQILLKIHKFASLDGVADDLFKVTRICEDMDVIGCFLRAEPFIIPLQIEGAREITFLPLIHGLNQEAHHGTSRLCPGPATQSQGRACNTSKPSSCAPHNDIRSVSRRLEIEFQKARKAGKCIILDSMDE